MVAPQLSHGGRPPLDGTAHVALAVGPSTEVVVTGPPYGQDPTTWRNTPRTSAARTSARLTPARRNAGACSSSRPGARILVHAALLGNGASATSGPLRPTARSSASSTPSIGSSSTCQRWSGRATMSWRRLATSAVTVRNGAPTSNATAGATTVTGTRAGTWTRGSRADRAYAASSWG